jgi:ABC-2 type transport system permease protein
MIATVARKEFLEMARSGRFRWAAAAILVLLLGSLVTGWHQYVTAGRQHRAMQQMERERWLNQDDMHPHEAAHIGLYVSRPPSPLPAMDNGVNAYTGVVSHLEAEEQKLFQFKPAQDEPPAQRLAELTVAAALQHLVPLLIIVSLFPAFVSEREHGTLRLLMSLGVRKSQFAWGKVLGTLAPIMLFLGLAAILGVVALGLNSAPDELMLAMPRAALLLIGYLAYFAIFAGLSLAVSAFARSSQQALTVLLAVWFINCVAAPAAAMNLAAYLYPEPNGFEFRAGIMEDQAKGAAATAQQISVQRQRQIDLLHAKYGRSVELSPEGIDILRTEVRDREMYEKHFSRLYRAYEVQNGLYQYAAVAAPLISIQSLSMAMTGSDLRHIRHFADSAEEYRRTFVGILNEDIALNDFPRNRRPTGIIPGQSEYRASRKLWAKVPPFFYSPPDLQWSIGAQWPGVFILGTWLVVAVALAAVAVARLRVG